MKTLIIAAFIILMTLSSISQPTFEMRTDNFKQIDESTIQWELWIKKTSGNDFGLYTWQLQWSFSSGLYNGGLFQGTDFTISPGADAVFAGHYNNADAVVNQTNHFFSYTPSSLPNTGEFMTLVTEEWKHIATYTAILSKNGNYHNFLSVDPIFAHRSGGIVQVFAADNPYQGPGTQSQITGTLTTAPGAKINTRELAGYWFTGDGNWSETARWNNVTTENANTVPPLATNNVGIAGQATLTDTRTVNQLTIAEEALLVLSGDAGNIGYLTVNGDLFNDNQTDETKSGTVTLAKWDFRDVDENDTGPWPAPPDVATTENQTAILSLQSPGNVTAAFTDYRTFNGYMSAWSAGGSWYKYFDPGMGEPQIDRAWYQIQFSTDNYQNIELSSRLAGTISPFKIQYRIGSVGEWVDIIEELIVETNFNTLVDEKLPGDLDNNPLVYIRWIYNGTDDGDRVVAITDIEVSGEEIPPPPTGLLIASTDAGTGSLIHNTPDVEATIERYIPETGYHLVSVPFTQASNPRSGWFIWSYLFEFGVATQTWVSLGNSVWTPLEVDKGYMVYKYPGPDKWSSDTTYAMTGLMNNGAFDMKVEYVGTVTNSFNLVPNPYPSAIDWNEAGGWAGRDDFNGAYWMWKQGTGYATWNGAVSVPDGAVSKDIPVGQSFFVLADNSNAALEVNNIARVHSSQAFHKKDVELYDLLRLKVITTVGNDELAIHFVDYATKAYDRKYDAIKMPGGTEFPQLYSYSADGRKLTINSLPLSDETNSITLGFDLSITGEVTFEFTSLESFDPDVTMFLWDMFTDTKLDLREKQQYTFMHHPDNNSARFALLFNSAVSVDEPVETNIQFYAVDNNLHISIPDERQESFDLILYNTSGQAVFCHRGHSGQSVITVPVLGQGVYIARLVSGEHSMVRKVFLK
jgi:hypothetical protein